MSAAITPYAFIPTRVLYNLENSDGSTGPERSDQPYPWSGTDSPAHLLHRTHRRRYQITNNIEYRIPIAGPVDFSFFTDLGMDMALNHNQLKLNPQANSTLNGALYGCPQLVNGTCQGGVTWPGGVPNRLGAIPGTNIQPRLSVGPQITAMLPIINAPVRIYFAFNPVRLHQDQGSQFIIKRSMFPAGGRRLYLYQQVMANYGSQYFLWEPRKTLRVSVSTSF